MARAGAWAMAAALLLLLLCAEAASHHLRKRDTSDASQPQTKPMSYVGKASSIAQEWLEKISVPAVREKISKSSDVVVTYMGIFADQLYHWWCGEQ